MEAPRPRPDRRTTPRYPVATRLFACIDGHTVILRNISRKGVAFQASGLPHRSRHLLEIHIQRMHISLPLEVIDTADRELLHARFLALSPDAQALIDQFISDFL